MTSQQINGVVPAQAGTHPSNRSNGEEMDPGFRRDDN
jgi:hypothetical protein